MKPRDLTPATKADLSNTRIELKTDIANLRTELKEDIRTTRHDLALQIERTQNDLREVKAVMATKDDVSKILGAIDSFAGQVTDVQRAVVLHGQILTEVQVKLADNIRRTEALERR